MRHRYLLAFFSWNKFEYTFYTKIYHYSFFFFFLMCVNPAQGFLNHLRGWETFFSFCHKNVEQDSGSLTGDWEVEKNWKLPPVYV